MKMDQKWILILAILALHQKITSAAVEKSVREGQRVDIKCKPALTTGSMVIWFRVLDKAGSEFIGSTSTTGIKKTSTSPRYTFSKTDQHILTVNSFTDRDSGIYSCALLRGSELSFGDVTRLAAEKIIVPTTATVTSAPTVKLCTTAAPCVCDNTVKRGETRPSMLCTPIILGPLAGGCGLLLLLLIVTAIYCNKIRTQRCPHHYKRKPRTTAAGKPMMTNRHI